jgi:probable HAF family extracellular repeat protein
MESTGLAISGNGQVLGGWGNSTNGTEAFRWTSGSGMVGLGDLPGGPFGSAVTAMSQDGNVLAGSGSTQDGLRAFRWTQQSGMMDIGTLTGSTTTVYGMSLDGSTIVGSSDRRAYRWTQGAGMSALLVAGGGNSEAKAASLDGSIIVGNGLPGAVMWLPGQQLATALQPYLSNELHLDLMGWTLFSCDAISADGRVIAGYGHDAGGRVRAWAAVIPSPSTGGIALAIWAVCAGRRRRHVVAG